MSLDVSLIGESLEYSCVCPHCQNEHKDTEVLYWANITHNLNTMAGKAGIYQHLWRPYEIDIETAEQLIEPLQVGLEQLQSDPEGYKVLNPTSGWGDYDGLVRFVSEYLAACTRHPQAKVRVSR